MAQGSELGFYGLYTSASISACTASVFVPSKGPLYISACTAASTTAPRCVPNWAPVHVRVRFSVYAGGDG